MRDFTITTTPDTMKDDERRSQVVLAALRSSEIAAFDALLEACTPAQLDELAASEYGTSWAAVPSELVPDDHRLRLLHIVARMHRYDGGANHLDLVVFEQLVNALEAGDVPWAEVGSRVWTQLTNHVGEATGVWPQARSLIERYPDCFDSSPTLLGAVANLAATAGATEAGELWNRVLTHPRFGDDAEQRLVLELDWVRGYLLYLQGDLRRGIAVLERLRRGFAEQSSPIAQLRWTETTLELMAALTWVGRAEEAMVVARESFRRVEPGGELEVWVRGAASLPAAYTNDSDVYEGAFDAIARASTDIASLELRGSIPARLVAATRHGNPSEVDAAIDAAMDIEGARPMDPELRLAWRVYAAEAHAATGDEVAARDMLDELRVELDSSPHELPTHRLRADLLQAELDDSGTAARAALEERARRLGIDVDAIRVVVDDGDVAEPDLRVRLLGRFAIERRGAPIPEDAWSGRRQAKMLLAMLLMDGGSVTSDHVAEMLWGDVDSQTARSRIAPLCAAIRSALAACEDADADARSLGVRGGTITLQLAPDDRFDLGEIRAVRDRVLREPARARDAALAAFELMRERPLADLGTDGAASMLRDDIERELLELAPQLAVAWEGRRAPDLVVDALERAHDLDPTSVETCTRLVQLHVDRGNLPAASSAFHRTRGALRDQLGMSVPEHLARLHAEALAALGMTSA